MKVVLNCVDAVATRKKFTIVDLPAVVGRGDDADVRIDDIWANHRHCLLDFDSGILRVRDLGSQHGTLVNGEAVDFAELPSGARLTVGISTFEISYRMKPRDVRILQETDAT